jgi:hypothetical protein
MNMIWCARLTAPVGRWTSARPCLLKWLLALVHHLIGDRGLSLTALVRCKYLLAEAVRREIDRRRQVAIKGGFQKALPGFSAAPMLADTIGGWRHAFTFRPNQYPARPPFYAGRFRFKKHYYPIIHDLREKRADGTPAEEFVCARAIDTHPAVKHWVRNVERDERFSFWLPTATDYFYPDFVAELNDGRVLVVEYKGAHLISTRHPREGSDRPPVGRIERRQMPVSDGCGERQRAGCGDTDCRQDWVIAVPPAPTFHNTSVRYCFPAKEAAFWNVGCQPGNTDSSMAHLVSLLVGIILMMSK